MDAAPASFVWQVSIALESGVTPDDIVGMLVAISPSVGMARIVAAAPEIAYALGLSLEGEGNDENKAGGDDGNRVRETVSAP
jgi:hypothetical protein